jgi:hypothetical protein
MKLSTGFIATTVVALGFLALDRVTAVRGQVGPGGPAFPGVQPPPVPSATVRRGGPLGGEGSSTSLRSQDYEFGRQAESLAAQFGAAKDGVDRDKIRTLLREVLDKQFAVHHQRREEELAKLEARVRSLREILTKRSEQRQTIVDRRLEQLIRDAEGLGWSGPSTGSAPSAGLVPSLNSFDTGSGTFGPTTTPSPAPYGRRTLRQ